MTKYVEDKLKANGFIEKKKSSWIVFQKIVDKHLAYIVDSNGTYELYTYVRGVYQGIKKFPTLKKFLQSVEKAKFVI